ncbi:MAG: RNA-processing protein [Thermoplasmata archaeon YP2-bin.285]|uniref:RNA-processing protein n=1 Tax=Candidatus Sysuiplasma superficiale TaxID=2823368 RepID=A0A8J7YKR5_9ARCH|nr:RNA-processing protein [Candidatus Sysuiplasma superficiale]
MQYLRIPRDRVGVLLGRDGSLKRKVEEETGVLISVDSDEGNVEIDGSKAPDRVMELKVASYVNAIGRGFSSQRARRLLSEDVFLEIMHISDYVGGRKNRILRMRGRIIGRGGRSRETLENLTETMISVQGDTVAIIGDPLELELARSSVDMLLRGSEHSSVFRFLESRQRELKLRELTYSIEPEWPEEE